jgi:hypothetical protein
VLPVVPHGNAYIVRAFKVHSKSTLFQFKNAVQLHSTKV